MMSFFGWPRRRDAQPDEAALRASLHAALDLRHLPVVDTEPARLRCLADNALRAARREQSEQGFGWLLAPRFAGFLLVVTLAGAAAGLRAPMFASPGTGGLTALLDLSLSATLGNAQ
ncbi:MAG TPA: hypothetical protein VMB71_10760 [Acetobacteraceae bacterium]|nr:hypothetical protein [Acetobacteraceae bacterium]